MKPRYCDLYSDKAYQYAVSNSKGNAKALNITLVGFYLTLIKVVGIWTALKVITNV